MSQAEKSADQIRRAAEREHRDAGTNDKDRGKSDHDSAAAHPTLTDTRLRKGHPPRDDDAWRDKPVDSERDKDLKEGGIEGAARRQRGGA